MKPFDIFNAKVVWNGCPDMRPWLVVEVMGDKSANCFPISGQHFGEDEAFFVDSRSHDFGATGLTKDCYIYYLRLYNIGSDKFVKHRGALLGDMLDEFRKAAGV